MENNENRRFEDYSDPAVTNLNGGPYTDPSGESTYSYAGSIPYDRNGQPLKNRFGMKLTFSIIEIVVGVVFMALFGLFGMIPMTCAILACVYTCLQNRDYKNGEWDGFVIKRKLSAIFLWIGFGVGLVLFLLLVVIVIALLAMGTNFFQIIDGSSNEPFKLDTDRIYEYLIDDNSDDNTDDWNDITDSDDDSDQEEVAASEIEGFESFRIDGTDITLPITVQELMDKGFYLVDEDLGKTVEANNSDGFAYYRTGDDAYIGTLFVYNTTNEDCEVRDGIVGGLTLNRNDDVDLTIVGGLQFGSSLEDAVDALGSEATSDYEDGDYGYYTWEFTDGYATSLELDFYQDELEEIWIMNYKDLSDY